MCYLSEAEWVGFAKVGWPVLFWGFCKQSQELTPHAGFSPAKKWADRTRSRGHRRRDGIPSPALGLSLISWHCFVLNRMHSSWNAPSFQYLSKELHYLGTWMMQSYSFMTTVWIWFCLFCKCHIAREILVLLSYTTSQCYAWWHVSRYTLQSNSWTEVRCQIPKMFIHAELGVSYAQTWSDSNLARLRWFRH